MFGQLFNAIGGFRLAKQQQRMADRINIDENKFLYNTSPFAKQLLGEAQMRKNALMPGMEQAQAQLAQAQANTTGALQRGATSGSNLLAMAAAINAQSGQNALGLAGQQAQWNQMANQDYQRALGVMVGEGDKEFQSRMQREGMREDRKFNLVDAAGANRQRSLGQIGSFIDSGIQTAVAAFNPFSGFMNSGSTMAKYYNSMGKK